jgi:hypothetical protein
MQTNNINLEQLNQSILKNENIAFKVQSSLQIKKQTIQKAVTTIFIITALLTSISTYKYLQSQQEILFISSILLFSFSVFWLVIYCSANRFSEIINKLNISPWFIGTDNFLLIIHNKNTLPIPWKYFSQDVKIKQNNSNIGNVTLQYDRKEFSKAIEGHFKNFTSSGTIYIHQIPNPTLIGEIARTKIRQNNL